MTSAQQPNVDRQERAFVIASDRIWNRNMPESLGARSGMKFVLISDPAELTAATLDRIDPEYVFFPHWSSRIDASIYNHFDCIIFHMTDLPFGRGGSPLQNLIAREIYETRISAIRCVEDLDAGPVYLNKPLSLHGSAEEIYARASAVIEDMILEIISQTIEPQPQQGEATVFQRRQPEDGDLARAESLTQLFDLIRMLDAEGYPRAFLQVGPLRMEFSRAARKTDHIVADVKISLADDQTSKR